MAHLISITENIFSPRRLSGRREVCAMAEASFDRNASRLQVKLESFPCRPVFEADVDQAPLDWLPQPMTVTESVSQEEAPRVAKAIFCYWVREVRRRIA